MGEARPRNQHLKDDVITTHERVRGDVHPPVLDTKLIQAHQQPLV